MTQRQRAFRILSLIVVFLSLPAFGQGGELGCIAGNRPAATLLFPYFEVDLADPQARTTLLSINNAGDEPVLTQVVLWTNCGFPALDFPLYLPPEGVVTLNLRDVIVAGQIPETGPDGGVQPFPSCSDPLPRPNLDAAARGALQTRLRGQADPVDGLCYGLPADEPQLAVGYVTVDVVGDCSETVRTPLDEGYFRRTGDGRARSDNVLWGDLFFVDGGEEAAQGIEAVSVVADPDHFSGDTFRRSFYSRDDDRLPLSSRFRTRFLQGSGFDGGTEVIVWVQSSGFLFHGPSDCEYACLGNAYLHTRIRNEEGDELDIQSPLLPQNVTKLRVGSDALPVDAPFGTLEFTLYENCPICSPPISGPAQGWVMPIFTASGKFSVGLSAVRLDDLCR